MLPLWCSILVLPLWCSVLVLPLWCFILVLLLWCYYIGAPSSRLRYWCYHSYIYSIPLVSKHSALVTTISYIHLPRVNGSIHLEYPKTYHTYIHTYIYIHTLHPTSQQAFNASDDNYLHLSFTTSQCQHGIGIFRRRTTHTHIRAHYQQAYSASDPNYLYTSFSTGQRQHTLGIA